MMLGILADSVSSGDVTHWSSIGASLVSTGFAVWYAWYMTTNRLPAIEKTHVEQMSASEQRHAIYIETLMTNFRSDLKSMWEIKREDDKRLSESLDRLSDILRQASCRYNPDNSHANR